MLTEASTARDWQAAALRAWRQKLHGVVEAVTGSGKTRLALMCIQEFLKVHDKGIVFIVVPTTALLDQWAVVLREDLGATESEVGLVGGGSHDWKKKRYVVLVINSARTFIPRLNLDVTPVMLVVDECHRAGSAVNAQIFRSGFAAGLGLSATPERQYDDGFVRYVKPALGEIIFRYDYKTAAADRVIAPFDLVNVRFSLTSDEQREYQRLTRRIAQLGQKDENAEKVTALLRKRARLSWNSPLRVPLAAKMAVKHARERVLVFHESVAAANRIYETLLAKGIRATIYHSALAAPARFENLRLYRREYYSCLVCCRALDEGLDVPSTSIGIVASSTASIRQRIQRLGRVLRAGANKRHATVYTLFATEVEESRLRAEEGHFEGISKVSWLRAEAQARG